jgi:hypothetical protein
LCGIWELGNIPELLHSNVRIVAILSRYNSLWSVNIIHSMNGRIMLLRKHHSEARIVEVLRQHQCDSYPIGKIIAGEADVELEGRIKWE